MKVLWILSLYGFVIYCVKNFVQGESCFSQVNDNQFRNSNQFDSSLTQFNRIKNTLLLFQNLRFAYSGSIERWEGTILLDSLSANQCDESEPLLFLQVWRPPNEEENSTFTLVASSPLNTIFDAGEATQGGNFTTISVNKSVEDDYIFFQQDDIVGIYVVADIAEAGLTFVPDLMMNSTAAMMKDIVVHTSQAPCQVSSDKWMEAQPRLPTILPYCLATGNQEEMDENSLLLMCSQTFNDTQPTQCNDTTAATERQPQAVVGLFFVVIASCITVTSIIAVTANCVIVCRAWCTRKQVKDRLLDGPIQRSTCNFIVNPEALQNDLPPNVRSLAEFLQYNIHHENTTERLNISWV